MLSYLVEIHKNDTFTSESWLSSVNTLILPSPGDIISFNTYRGREFKTLTEAKVLARHFCYEVDWAQKVLLVVAINKSEDPIPLYGFDDVDVCNWDEYEDFIENLPVDNIKVCFLREANIRFKAEMALRQAGYTMDSDGTWVKGPKPKRKKVEPKRREVGMFCGECTANLKDRGVMTIWKCSKCGLEICNHCKWRHEEKCQGKNSTEN